MGFAEVFALMIALVGLVSYVLLTHDLEFDKVSIATVGQSAVIPTSVLALFRASCFGLIGWSCWHLITDSDGLRLEILMLDGSNRKIHLLSMERLTTFTVWCWCLQGVYFLLATLVSIIDVFSSSSSSPPHELLLLICKVATVLYEVSFSVAFLVSSVVTFVLIPATLKRNLPLDSFYLLLPLIMHNANAIFMTIELCINQIEFSQSHYVFSMMLGMAYVLFSWFWFRKTGIFYYFFLDYARPGALFSHVGLMALLSMCFFGGSVVSRHVKDGSVIALVILLGVTFLVLKLPPSLSYVKLRRE